MNYEDFLMGENRYKQLVKKDEALAKQLFAEASQKALETYEHLKKLSENN
jgi:pyruvate/2-oxoacid:ferredoxin oxidoreductase beta subunit